MTFFSYADDLVLISKSVQGLYKQIYILNEYYNKWLLKINLKKTKTKTKAPIFQKQNRKSTQDKYTFFLNGNSISTNKLQVSSILEEPKLVNSKLPKIKQAIIDYFKKGQVNWLRSYKKLNFHFTFKNDVSKSEYLDLIKNEKHHQAVAKFTIK